MISFAFHKASMGFELIYWIYMGGYYFLVDFNLEKCGNLGKTAIFSVRYGRIRDMQHGRNMAGVGSKGIKSPKLSIYF